MADRSCLGMSKNRTVSLYLDNFPAFSGEIWEKKKKLNSQRSHLVPSVHQVPTSAPFTCPLFSVTCSVPEGHRSLPALYRDEGLPGTKCCPAHRSGLGIRCKSFRFWQRACAPDSDLLDVRDQKALGLLVCLCCPSRRRGFLGVKFWQELRLWAGRPGARLGGPRKQKVTLPSARVLQGTGVPWNVLLSAAGGKLRDCLAMSARRVSRSHGVHLAPRRPNRVRRLYSGSWPSQGRLCITRETSPPPQMFSSFCLV